MIVVVAVRDGAAIQRDAGDIQSRQGHRCGRDGLVAAAQHHHRVEAVAVDGQLDRIGDHLATDERGAHARGAHGDAIGDRDGVEFDRRATGGADAGGRVLGQLAQVEVARADVRPGVHHRDQRLADVGVVQAGSAQHRAGGSPVGAGLDLVTAHQKSPKGRMRIGYSRPNESSCDEKGVPGVPGRLASRTRSGGMGARAVLPLPEAHSGRQKKRTRPCVRWENGEWHGR
jgi:hypothetical protein